LLYFGGIFGINILRILKMDQNRFNLAEQASEMSKITLSVIVYTCLNKTITKINKCTVQLTLVSTNPLRGKYGRYAIFAITTKKSYPTSLSLAELAGCKP